MKWDLLGGFFERCYIGPTKMVGCGLIHDGLAPVV